MYRYRKQYRTQASPPPGLSQSWTEWQVLSGRKVVARLGSATACKDWIEDREREDNPLILTEDEAIDQLEEGVEFKLLPGTGWVNPETGHLITFHTYRKLSDKKLVKGGRSWAPHREQQLIDEEQSGKAIRRSERLTLWVDQIAADCELSPDQLDECRHRLEKLVIGLFEVGQHSGSFADELYDSEKSLRDGRA